MATNGGIARDAAARRRRIAERGAERLALITGRVQSLSSSPLPPVAQSEPSPSPPCPTSVSPNSDQLNLTDSNSDTLSNIEAVGSDVASDVRSVIDNPETITETSAQTSSKPDKIQSFSDTLTEQTPPISTSNKSKKPESQTLYYKTFSPKQLRPAISASERIRTICSIIVAVLVMLADAGFPVLGSDAIKNIILFRPLWLLLVTNITTVTAHFLLQKVKHRSTGEEGFADHIGTVLEWGWLVKTGSSALFMDCSVYSVVVICGMGLLQLFRS
ncbi:hypothetical protein L1987_00143 [Smallanthus sonchifolius]|uniref:Uncharacterized protein n=1 Tax=Smallanthus sonchifolius TaxID=185202 RepID=A0ACB9K1M7_9ASTR|nr:hypothetical protein L1987_00143 [Smallanthus sonchifolius]